MAELGLNAYRFSVAWPRVAARRDRAGERGRARLLRPARRRAAAQGDRAARDALPLGPAAGARGRGRLAGPLDRGCLRRLRGRRRPPPRRPRRGDRDPQRAVVQRGISATGLGMHAPGRTDPAAANRGGASPPRRPRARGPRRSARPRRGRRSGSCSTSSPSARPRPTRSTWRRRASRTTSTTAGSSIRSWVATTRRTACGRRAGSAQEVRAGDMELIATPIDFVGVNYYTSRTIRSPLLPPPAACGRGRA